MEKQELLLDLEERFWKGTQQFYEDNLADDAVMVFPDPVGFMTRSSIVRSISESARWTSIEFSGTTLLTLAPDAILLTYRATARRDQDSSPYEARASSVYVDRNGWKLAFHQQTPAG